MAECRPRAGRLLRGRPNGGFLGGRTEEPRGRRSPRRGADSRDRRGTRANLLARGPRYRGGDRPRERTDPVASLRSGAGAERRRDEKRRLFLLRRTQPGDPLRQVRPGARTQDRRHDNGRRRRAATVARRGGNRRQPRVHLSRSPGEPLRGSRVVRRAVRQARLRGGYVRLRGRLQRHCRPSDARRRPGRVRGARTSLEGACAVRRFERHRTQGAVLGADDRRRTAAAPVDGRHSSGRLFRRCGDGPERTDDAACGAAADGHRNAQGARSGRRAALDPLSAFRSRRGTCGGGSPGRSRACGWPRE